MKQDLDLNRRRSHSPRGIGRRRFFVSFVAFQAVALAAMATPPAAPPPPVDAAPASKPLPSADEILDRYEQAIGGRERWLRDHSRTIVYKVELRTAAEGATLREVEGTMTVHRKAPDRMHSRLEVPELGVFEQGFDGTRGWSIRDGGEPRMLKGAELAERWRESIVDREIRLRELYSRLEVLGEREIEGRRCWLVRFGADDGAQAQALFDAEHGRMVVFARRLDAGGTPVTVAQRMDDWREVDGQWFAHRIEQTVGATTQIMTLQSIDHECIEDSVFELPQGVKPATRDEAPASPATPSPPPPPAPADAPASR